MTNIQLAMNLKYLRKKNNLKQDDMVNIVNVSRQAYSNYETLSRTPDIDTLMTLANYYNVSLNDLVLCNLSGDSAPFEGMSEGEIPYIYTEAEKTLKNKKTGEETKIDTTIYLSEEELEMILKFRTLAPDKQALIKGFLLHE